jgi:hypothetical protein
MTNTIIIPNNYEGEQCSPNIAHTIVSTIMMDGVPPQLNIGATRSLAFQPFGELGHDYVISANGLCYRPKLLLLCS